MMKDSIINRRSEPSPSAEMPPHILETQRFFETMRDNFTLEEQNECVKYLFSILHSFRESNISELRKSIDYLINAQEELKFFGDTKPRI